MDGFNSGAFNIHWKVTTACSLQCDAACVDVIYKRHVTVARDRERCCRSLGCQILLTSPSVMNNFLPHCLKDCLNLIIKMIPWPKKSTPMLTIASGYLLMLYTEPRQGGKKLHLKKKHTGSFIFNLLIVQEKGTLSFCSTSVTGGS